MKELEIKIEKRLRELRKEAGLTQEELGRKVGLEKNTISSYESDVRKPSAYIAAKIARTLNVSLDYLCSMTNDRYEIRIPKDVELDLTRLNPEGVKALCEYYRFLCKNKNYTE